MKSIKLFAVAACALLATACSNNDEKFVYNTAAGVTVEMGDATAEFTENQGVVSIPVNVIGEPNGYVTVTIECEGVGENAAIPNRRFYLTTDKLNISKEDKTVDVEFSLVDNRGVDETQTFVVTIVSAQGAEIGAQKSTTVNILDKGTSPLYTELPGNYLLQTYVVDDEGVFAKEYISDVRLSLGTPDEKGGGTVMLQGVLGQFQMELVYDYDPEEKYGSLVFNYGQEAFPNAPYDQILWCSDTGGGTKGSIVGKWNSTYTSCSFGDDGTGLYIGVWDQGSFLGILDAMGQFTLIRVPD